MFTAHTGLADLPWRVSGLGCPPLSQENPGLWPAAVAAAPQGWTRTELRTPGCASVRMASRTANTVPRASDPAGISSHPREHVLGLKRSRNSEPARAPPGTLPAAPAPCPPRFPPAPPLTQRAAPDQDGTGERPGGGAVDVPRVADDVRGALLQAGGGADVVDAQEAAAGEGHAPAALAVQHGGRRGRGAPVAAAAIRRLSALGAAAPHVTRRPRPRRRPRRSQSRAAARWYKAPPANQRAHANKAPPPSAPPPLAGRAPEGETRAPGTASLTPVGSR